MKTCPRCNEKSDDQFDSCWRCSTPLPSGDFTSGPAAPFQPPGKKADFRIFRGTFSTWNSLCTEAAEFATTIGPKDLITISHSEDKDSGVITVWFWTNDYRQPAL